MRRIIVALLLSALTSTAVVALPTVSASAADPHPVAPTIHTLPLTGVDSSALTAQRRTPASITDPDAAWTRESAAPAVFTGQLHTAAYSAVGVTWQRPTGKSAAPNIKVAVRTYDGSWQPWTTLEADADLPSGGTAGSTDQGNGRGGTDPYFAGPSTGIQVRVDVVSGALPTDLRVELVDPGTSAADSHLNPSALSTASAAAALPRVVTRAQWGADESLRGSPRYDSSVKMAFIHHTASSNAYTKAQAPAAMRAIYAYDTKGLGWSDIAYNVIVDKFGEVFEGRAGGLERAVRSAATGGFNPTTFSVSALGLYSTVNPTSAMVTSIERVLAWKLGLYHLNPVGKVTLVASSGDGTTSRYANGVAHSFDVISGHRDAGLTACPGNLLYAKLPAIRAAVKKLIGAAILGPKASTYVVDKGSVAPVVLTAKAMNAQSWQLLVQNSTGHTVRTIKGSAPAGGTITASWNDNTPNGQRVSPGVYTLTLSSWTADAAAVPYLVNVAIDPDPNIYNGSGTIKLQGLGYGHGHGMSQFGAAGAAVKGLTAPQILSFYYPGTTLETVPTSTRIRVRLLGKVHVVSGAPDVRVKAVTGLWVFDGTRVLDLPTKIGTSTITMWRARLNASGHLDLFGMHGATSTLLKGWSGLTTPLRFTTTPSAPFTAPPTAPTMSRVSVYDAAGGVRTYRGTIEASPSADGKSLDAVSDVRLDDYVKAVVSSEMPGGWLEAAYQAQAVAARSYALFKHQHAASSARWDVVDSTTDQVYTGFTGETSPESSASAATAGQYLTYQGQAIFAQYFSADGGWTLDGGQPYLTAHADPYDGVLTGAANWGHSWAGAVTSTSIQHIWPSIGTLQSLDVVDRDGHGSWGGRTVSVELTGSAGQVSVAGTSFRSALGLRSDWWRVDPTPVQPTWPPPVPPNPVKVQTIPSVPQALRVVARDRHVTVSWKVPLDNGNTSLTGYHVTLSPGLRTMELPASARSATFLGLLNGKAYTVTVSAKNVKGTSPRSKASVTPLSPWTTYVPLPATSLGSTTLRPSPAKTIHLLGKAGVPTSLVGSVTLRITTRGAAVPTSIALSGVKGASPSLFVPAHSTTVSTVVLPVGANGSITLRASHPVHVEFTVVGYHTKAGAVGQRLVTVAPFRAGGGTSTAATPLQVLVAGKGGAPINAVGVLAVLTGTAKPGTTVRLTPALNAPAVSRLSLPSGKTRSATVYLPIAADGTVTVSTAGTAKLSVVVLGYLVADDGVEPSGRYQALPSPARVFDSAVTFPRKPLASGVTRHAALLGKDGVPMFGVRALLLHVTITSPSRTGWLTVAGHGDPAYRVLNYEAGGPVDATIVVRPGARKWVDLMLRGGNSQVTVDVLGWWSA